ncbi:Adenylosuccinate synthetase [Tricharina praecox]|uniref:Adenylosuccinate synthetase n=1 Tax=Tricharina praecox TaxID=43433 RepID=UPI0022200A65|nr:Adenylosuccinate synthetase [Tricharina praecox]KAI5854390.1 Adenylosuccinate synthetase [Tricharina praecox]
MATVVLGSQWGDEGKGKLVDILCEDVEVCARCAGGNNAGHTIVVNGVSYDFHMLPSGLVNPKCLNLIGTGTVVHIPSFFAELEAIQKKGIDSTDRIFISDRAHLVFDLHQLVDGLEEIELGAQNIGTTRKGIGPTYSTKAARSGVRVYEIFNWSEFEKKLRALEHGYKKRFGDLLQYDVEKELAQFKVYYETLRPYVIDAVPFIAAAFKANKKVLVEGANALMLDIDYGTYPYVTSSNTGVGGVITGLAISPFNIKNIIGVVKAYTTRVGSGPFPTEQLNEAGEHLQVVGREWGVTTGRKRRCGWLDLVIVKYSTAVNHYTSLNLTKLDILDGLKELQIAVAYKVDGVELESFPADLNTLAKVEPVYKTMPGWTEPTTKLTEYDQLPKEAKEYIAFIEEFIGVRVDWVGVGPGREHMLYRQR